VRTVHGSNADLIAAASALYIRDGALVADVTYGTGVFWRKINGRFDVIGSDLVPRAPNVIGADMRALPYRDGTFDAVSIDPPYMHHARPHHVHDRLYNGVATTGMWSHAQIMDLYRAGMTEARRVLKPRGRMFIKGQDQIESGRQQWASIQLHQMAVELRMVAIDQLLLITNGPPGGARRWKRQLHAHRGHSFLWVFERR
jgi:methylase of polypeptide subunit release factors